MTGRHWGPVGEWVEVATEGEVFRYRRVAHNDGWWRGLEVQHQDRNGTWVGVGKRFMAGFVVGRLVPVDEWPAFESRSEREQAP